MNLHSEIAGGPRDAGVSAPGEAATQSHYVISGAREKGVLLVCDHARNWLPEAYGDLGLPHSELERHIGYDIGAEAMTRALAQRLGVPAVLSCFSRLLIDPNRGQQDPTLIMELSDGAVVPGNAGVSAEEREHRLNSFHRPYHAAITAEIDAFLADGTGPVLVSMHSFTPFWKGRARPWEIGFLWDDDRRCTDLFISYLKAHHAELCIGDNEPYAGGLKGDCMDTHAVQRKLPHTLIEVRQDLVSDEAGVAHWTGLLGDALEEMIEKKSFERLHFE